MVCALVTGGSRGIGNKIVKQLILSEKWGPQRLAQDINNKNKDTKTIVYLSRNRASVEAAMGEFARCAAPTGAVSSLAAQVKLIGVPLDVNDFQRAIPEGFPPLETVEWDSACGDTSVKRYASVDALFKALHQSAAFPDVVVQSHGITQERLSVGMRGTQEVLELVSTNFVSNVVIGNFFMKRWVAQRLRAARAVRNMAATVSPEKKGTDRRVLLNITSVLGTQPGLNLPGTSVYSAMKSGLAKYTEVLAREMVKHREWLAIKSYAPPLVTDTDMVRNLQKSQDGSVEDHINALVNGGETDRTAPRIHIGTKTSDQVALDILLEIEEIYARK